MLNSLIPKSLFIGLLIADPIFATTIYQPSSFTPTDPFYPHILKNTHSLLDIIWLNSTNHDPLAVCNDGTPAAMYY